MKKIALLAFSLFVFSTVAQAQNQGFGWGVKAGMNVAGITHSDLDPMVGFTGGLFGDYRFNDLFALSADVLYSAQGNHSDKNNKTTLSYLNVPILANFYPIPDLGLAVKIGLQPGFLLGQTTYFLGEKFTGTDGLRTFDLVVPVGVSFEAPFRLIVDARYNFGTVNIDNDFTGKNSYFSLTVGYRF